METKTIPFISPIFYVNQCSKLQISILASPESSHLHFHIHSEYENIHFVLPICINHVITLTETKGYIRVFFINEAANNRQQNNRIAVVAGCHCDLIQKQAPKQNFTKKLSSTHKALDTKYMVCFSSLHKKKPCKNTLLKSWNSSVTENFPQAIISWLLTMVAGGHQSIMLNMSFGKVNKRKTTIKTNRFFFILI